MRLVTAALVVSSLLLGCAPSDLDPSEEDDELAGFSEEELTEAGFDRNRLVSDAVFTDADAMSEAEIQAFLSATPYGGKSVLASYQSNGRTAARAIFEAAQKHGLNPLMILTRAQMEQSLIGKATASSFALNYAFGCGCPDNKSCSAQFKGFDKQVECMAGHMRSYLDDLEGGGATIAGYQIGKAKKTLDPTWVTPKNAATAALYTYTPWVGTKSFGNLAHFVILKKFSAHVGYAPAGPGGCLAVSYPSGLLAQSLPAEAMTEAYVTSLASLGVGAESAPSCFLDPFALENPTTGVVADKGAKVASNFAFQEFLVGEPTSRHVLLDPGFVAAVQKARTSLGVPVRVEDAFRSPERHLELCAPCSGACEQGCEATLPMALGRGAVISAGVSPAELREAAAAAGFSACLAHPQGLYVHVGAPALGCAP